MQIVILGGLSQSIPNWLLVWIAIAAGVAWIIGAKRAATALTLVPIGKWIIAPLFAPVMRSLPWWVGPLADAVTILLLLQGVITLVFGPAVAAHVIGALLLRALDVLFLGPFRGLRWLLRLLIVSLS